MTTANPSTSTNGSESCNTMSGEQDTEQSEDYSGYSATYSPEDNKLRLYASSRLDKALYQRVRGAGFISAPKQELFVAPMWTPSREDLLIELCGDIGDEDSTLVERATERAGRFDDYRDNRSSDAEDARLAVAAIADGIPLGQPILVGHHSERHARKHAEQIESGMRRAVKMWETAEYWKYRAAGALRHAKYKQLPAVRARRIKTLEAEKRKQERTLAPAQTFLRAWQVSSLTQQQAEALANGSYYSQCFPLADYPRQLPASQYEGEMGLWSALNGGVISALQARDIALRVYPRVIAHASRWIAHYENRIAYEQAMLAEQGGTLAEQTRPEKGGAVRCWVGRGAWVYIQKVNKVSVTVLDNWGNGGKNFTRTVPLTDLKGLMSAAQVDQARADALLLELEDKTGFQLRATPQDVTLEETTAERNQRLHREHLTAAGVAETATASKNDSVDFQMMKEQLHQGVQVVSAPQLFPTPAALAVRMVDLAGFRDIGLRVLEPSAGTGSILRALPGVIPFPMAGGRQTAVEVVAVEINPNLADALERSELATTVKCADFLQCQGELGQFDRVLLNPPFENGADMLHIRHAASMLKPGGRLVAICANGPRQNAQLRPWVEASGGHWEPLPAGTFATAGTSVNTVLLSFNA